jgi:hypothetical protein
LSHRPKIIGSLYFTLSQGVIDMRFVSILLQWFAKHKPNPDDTETKKAVMKLLLLDNFVIIALSF